MAAILAVATVALVLVGVQPAASAQALSGSSFDPGDIISDYEFYNSNALTQAEIQAFLDKQCPTHNCIDVTKTTSVSMARTNMCPGGYVGLANESTAAIIYKIQKSCGISAKVILVMLQKEQSLVTRKNPSAPALNAAMGYGCSDSSACIAAYSGLFKQIYNAASQLIRYGLRTADNVSYRTRFQIGVPYPIATHSTIKPPCPTKTVMVKNKATTALYYYTPYVPNAAALANLTGNGDRCSSFGNRNFWVFYNNWFGSPTTTVPPGVTVSRIGGADRFVVSVGVSRSAFAAGVPVVYIADGLNFPDALTAAPAAAKQGGPLLLVRPTLIPSEVLAEIQRLRPQKIVVVGGPASVAPNVLAQLTALQPNTTRIGGADRYEVSRNLAKYAFGIAEHNTGSTHAYVATGRTFPDALSASAAAGAQGAPVILVDGIAPKLDPAVSPVFADLGITTVSIAGGPASVTPATETALAFTPGVTGVRRFGGADRYVVSGAINRAEFTSASTIYVAVGTNFPDALSGAALAGARKAPLYVVRSNCIPTYVLDDFLSMKPSKMVILGGTGSLTTGINKFTGC